MLDVSSLLLNYTFKTTAPLVDAIVNETLSPLVPRLDNGHLQLIDGGNPLPAVDKLLKVTPNGDVSWVQVCTVWRSDLT
jgi:hypothetical protein